MASLAFERLHNLDKSRSDWRIKARVTRMWPTVSVDTGATRGFNMILLDDDNTHVHAFAYTDTWNYIGRNVVEGGVYFIQDFAIKDSVGTLKPVSSSNTIRFNNSTTFESTVDDSMIPLHKFEFLDLGDLYNQASLLADGQNPEYATDVIGVVEDYVRCRRIGTKFGERDVVRFKLSDGSFRHRVAVWGDLATSVNEAYNEQLEKPVIAILTSTKLATYKNTVQISTLPSSKVYFNLNDDCVSDMRQRMEEENYKPPQNVDEHGADLAIADIYEFLSLKQLNDMPSENIKKKIYCTFTISKVVDYCFWWYNPCNRCHYQVLKVDKCFKCEKCPRTIPLAEKRFRVLITAVDSTFSCNLFLMDRVVKPLIGISASNLKKATDNDPKMVPDIIAELAGKEITVTIEVIEDNKSECGFVFHATDLYDLTRVNTSCSNISTPPDVPAIALTDSVDDIGTSRTPGSAISVNKKIKMEK